MSFMAAIRRMFTPDGNQDHGVVPGDPDIVDRASRVRSDASVIINEAQQTVDRWHRLQRESPLVHDVFPRDLHRRRSRK